MVQEIREMIRTVYGKYDVWLRALGKFSLAFGSLLVIRNFMGYLPLLDNILILLILALVASFLPLNGMVLICFVLPAVLSWIFCALLRKWGWIKENDLKLEL